MTQSIESMIEVLEGARDRKVVEVRLSSGWAVAPTPCWDFATQEYRIKPEKKVAYVNIYPFYSDKPAFVMEETREASDVNASSDRIACVKIEYEEGQFDS